MLSIFFDACIFYLFPNLVYASKANAWEPWRTTLYFIKGNQLIWADVFFSVIFFSVMLFLSVAYHFCPAFCVAEWTFPIFILCKAIYIYFKLFTFKIHLPCIYIQMVTPLFVVLILMTRLPSFIHLIRFFFIDSFE